MQIVFIINAGASGLLRCAVFMSHDCEDVVGKKIVLEKQLDQFGSGRRRQAELMGFEDHARAFVVVFESVKP